MNNIAWLYNPIVKNTELYGVKSTFLYDMLTQKQNVAPGFVISTEIYKEFLQQNKLKERIDNLLNKLDVKNIISIAKTSRQIQNWIIDNPFATSFELELNNAYNQIAAESDFSFAIRESLTSNNISFQRNSCLNIKGVDHIKVAIKKIFSSLYNDQAIVYKFNEGFNAPEIYTAIIIQKMVRSDIASSGNLLTVDPKTGFNKVVFINSNYGLSESITQGIVAPDEFYIYKPNLTNNIEAIVSKNIGSKTIKTELTNDEKTTSTTQNVNLSQELRRTFSINNEQIISLSKIALNVEKYYNQTVEIKWAIDGIDNKIYIIQVNLINIEYKYKDICYRVIGKKEQLLSGYAIGQKSVIGIVKVINSYHQADEIEEGDILVTDTTNLNWEFIIKKTTAVITNHGARTSHTAMIARELGITAIVGTHNATQILKTGMKITVCCSEGSIGYVYAGFLTIEKDEIDIKEMPEIPVKMMLNIGNPELAFKFSAIPNSGVGLARLEFIINKQIGIHPKAILEYKTIPSQLKDIINEKISGYLKPIDFYIDKLTEGIATIAAAFYPKEIIIRLSDFKTNEYFNLIGGQLYEPTEANPIMGFRGASRYLSDEFRGCFELECIAIDRVRHKMGFNNINIMIPFVRTVKEAANIIKLLHKNNLSRSENLLKIYMMCEIPSNAILADKFLEHFDGFSIGSNDMTQLALGIDRNSHKHTADERNEAVKMLLHLSIEACLRQKKYIGICGQGPSDHPDFAQWLIKEKVNSISLNPDSIINTWRYLGNNLC